MEQLKELQRMKEAYTHKLKTEGATIIKQIVNEVFSVMPEIYSFSWIQYTPYFNDGDPCIFCVHEPSAWYTKESMEEDEDGEGEINSWALSKYITENRPKPDDEYYYDEKLNAIEPARIVRLKECFDAINNNEDLMEMSFGDGVSILFTRDSDEPIISEYDHD